jgi:hypothetical protein
VSPLQQIRHATLPTAIRRLAIEPSMQEHPLILLFLQNLVERVADQSGRLDGLADTLRLLTRRANEIGRRVDALPDVGLVNQVEAVSERLNSLADYVYNTEVQA